MRTIHPAPGLSSSCRRFIPGMIAVALLLLFGFAQRGSTQSSAAPAAPLNFGNNFFVTGDYLVAGAQGMNSHLSNGFATGTIAVPDTNPGITGAKSVPPGAQVVAALLYWQTAEKITVVPGDAGSGANGFFRPVYKGGPASGYPITGMNATSHDTVSFSSGGCSGTSTGKILRTYRADVRAYLPQDSSGDVTANGTYEVRLPSVGNSTPLTLGATLVIIYRVLSPSVPLNSIVIYDGAFGPTSASPVMSQSMQGFYDAAKNPVSRLTHIVSSGQSNKFQTVSLNGVPLPSLYRNGQPPFPGFYGNWDNPTWTFGDPTVPAIANPIREDNASATTQVVPNSSNQGCVSWGAVILSTTVKNSDNDGLLDAWKANHGYCDASINEGVCSTGNLSDPAWVDLTGATKGKRDVFVQLDYMCSSVSGTDVNSSGSCSTSNGNYSFDPRLTKDPFDGKDPVQKVVDAYASSKNHAPVSLHVVYRHAIQEEPCADAFSPLDLCAFPNQPGAVGWPGGFVFYENQFVDPSSGNLCLTSPPAASCVPVFQHGKKDSYHHALFAHALGLPSWTLQSGTLKSVVQTGSTVTFTTSAPHGFGSNVDDPTCSSGRVTVAYAISNLNLNGTFCVTVIGSPATSTSFSITAPNSTNFTYTTASDPNLAVASGQAGTVSGFSDIGGAHSIIALGNWGTDGQTWQVKAGTLMHELGHSVGLTHGGLFENNASNAAPDYTPSVEVNCKPNFQTVMNYLFQLDLLDNGTLSNVPDYSAQALGTLNESNTTSSPFNLTNYLSTSWYAPRISGTPANQHCDGTPLLSTDKPMSFVSGATGSLSWTAGQDINFDGTGTDSMRGHNDWVGSATMPGIDLRQISATGTLSASGLAGRLGGGGGLAGRLGGGGGVGGLLDGGGGLAGRLGGGGGLAGKLGGGGGLGGRLGGGGGIGELNRTTANSVTRPPRNLIASEEASARFIDLNWTAPTFGTIGAYRIYRSADGGTTFPLLATVPGTQLTYQDAVTCNPTGYQYRVTAVLAGTFATFPPGPLEGQESVPSNTVSSSGQSHDPLTGCYTLTGAGFAAPVAGTSAIQGSVVPIAWSVKDDFYFNNNNPFVNNVNANTVVAIGPISNDQVCGPVAANTPRTTIAQRGAGISVSQGPNYLFTFSWNTTAFAAGCYFLELDLDSGQPNSGGQQASAFQVLLYLSDVSLHVATTALPDGVVGSAYNQTLAETGGTTGGGQPFTWTVISGALPPGIALGLAPDAVSGALTGTPTVPGNYSFTVHVTDSIGDFGTQALAMRVDAVVTNTNDSGAGSLRQAIIDVNAQSNAQPIGIVFKIPGNGVQTITPLTPLPTLMSPTILDATTQPGYAGTPLIELNGSTAGGSANGLHVAAGSSTVGGLVIDSFSGDGILIDTNGNDVIQGNYVGTDVTGTVAQANGGNGVQIIDAPNNVIGGTTSSARNIISGNTGEGVRIDGALATGNVVRGNYIGTNVAGSAAVGNHASGVYIRRAPGNSIVGNTVSGNAGFAGISICGSITFCGGGDNFGPGTPGNSAPSNIVQGNFVGTDPAGTSAVGNNQAGVSIDGAPNTTVGGTTAALHNIISFNGTNDIQIFDTGAGGNQIQGNTIQGSTTATTVGISADASLIGNTLTQNSISGHAGLGIDLSPSGPNANQPGGGNNFPVITSAQFAGGTTTIMGTLNSTANATFTIEFFSNQACNASGNGEGAVFLGAISVQTDGSGNAGFTFMVAGPATGNAITSTSTDAFGTTSEFSACVPVN